MLDQTHGLFGTMIKPLCLGLGLLALGACAHTDVAQPAPGETPMRNEVTMVRLTHIIAPEDDKTDTPSVATQAALQAFLTSVNAGYGDIIMLDSASGPDRVAALVKLIQKRGLVYGGEATLGSMPEDGAIMVYVERYIVTTPNCMQWPDETSNNTRNNASSYFGCADTTNLGLMVANPRDLIAGQNGGNSTAAAVGAIYKPTSTSSGPSMTLSLDGLTNPTAQPSVAPSNGN